MIKEEKEATKIINETFPAEEGSLFNIFQSIIDFARKVVKDIERLTNVDIKQKKIIVNFAKQMDRRCALLEKEVNLLRKELDQLKSQGKQQ